jgi:hypothetical protein
VRALDRAQMVFGTGPAGTGKTYMAVAYAAALLERGDVERMILSRPAVEAGERLGFLPGDMKEKIDPYLRPLYDALYDMMPPTRWKRACRSQMIEIAPLAFMRGRTLSNAVVILDEAQNTTSMQMKMFLTRLGEGSKMIVTGDPSQVDLPPGQVSGLAEAYRMLRGIDGIVHVKFRAEDVVRHPLVTEIVNAYDEAARRRVRAAAERQAPLAGRGPVSAHSPAIDLVVEAGDWPQESELLRLVRSRHRRGDMRPLQPQIGEVSVVSDRRCQRCRRSTGSIAARTTDQCAFLPGIGPRCAQTAGRKSAFSARRPCFCQRDGRPGS